MVQVRAYRVGPLQYFQRLSSKRYRPGLERDILRLLPRIIAAGILALCIAPVWVRCFPPIGSTLEVTKQVKLVDYVSIATGLTFLTAVFTVSIGCILVKIMKGPAYVADGYPLPDAPTQRDG